MSREEVYRAVRAFLDEYIARGAAKELHDLRDRLANDANARQLLDDQLPSSDPSEVEAYEAMIAFIDAADERKAWLSVDELPGIRELASSIAVPFFKEGVPQTCDPGMWSDWLSAVERARTSLG